ncbi:MAG: DUF4402 domain-containing protein [Pseudomonadota bacterium]
MTKFRVSAFALMAVAGFGASAANAEDADFTASANILQALALTKQADLAFANIVPDATTAGTVVVSTAGIRTCNAPLSCSGTVTAADFDVLGTAGYTFAITLPASDNITNANGDTMSVDNFVSSIGNTGTLTGGTADFSLGATLNVGAAQAAGAYTGTFTVTVEYN